MNDTEVNDQNFHCDKIDPLTQNLSESLFIKDYNLFNNNILFSTGNSEMFDKEYNSVNYLESFKEECLNGNNSFKNDKETLSYSKKLLYSDVKTINEEEVKRQLKLKRNRESAKEGRIRKKEFIQSLINENICLKNKYKDLLNIIHKCPKCQEIYNSNIKNEKKIS